MNDGNHIIQKKEDWEKIFEGLTTFMKDHSINIVLFKGGLGAGKTSAIKIFASFFGCLDEVTSPSFSLINEYGCKDGKLIHMDLYRLKNIEEALDIGVEDYLHSCYPVLIEWPEVIEPLLEDLPNILIEIRVTENQFRQVSIKHGTSK